MKFKPLLGALALVASSLFSTANAAVFTIGGISYNSTPCATEGGTCTLPTTSKIAYGVPGVYLIKTLPAGLVTCTNKTFGLDPAPGKPKSCWLPSAPAPAPAPAPTPAPAFSTTPCAVEGTTCLPGAPVTISYGVGTRTVVKSFTTNSVLCNNNTFGLDPAPGTAKACYYQSGFVPVPFVLQPPTGLSAPLAPTAVAGTPPIKPTFKWGGVDYSVASCGNGMGVKCTVTVNTTIAYGKNTAFDTAPIGPYVVKSVTPGTYACEVSTFGSDPDPALRNYERACYVPVAALPVVSPLVIPPAAIATMTSTAPADLPPGTWTQIALGGQVYSFTGTRNIRWTGDGATWYYRQDTLNGECTNSYMNYWKSGIKECQIFNATDSTQNLTMKMGDMPVVDVNQIPKRATGFNDYRISYHPNDVLNTDLIGAFRMGCGFSHMGFNDPIVFPGQSGASHLHTFFGNTGADANSTPISLTGSGNSTCHGGIINRSSYWVPTMIDTRTNTPLEPESNQIYYKTGYDYIAPANIQPLPFGLRMIAGNAKATTDATASRISWSCQEVPVGVVAPVGGNGIPNCPIGSTLMMGVDFPQCWDGVNLDSPDHKSHMAYPGFGCPSTHPVPLTHISFNIRYRVKEANTDTYWRLSSDNYPMGTPGGFSGHGDWFNGWSGYMNNWLVNCNNHARDCHSNNLGDGNWLDSY